MGRCLGFGQQQVHVVGSLATIRGGDVFSGRDESSENEIGQRQHDIEIVEVALVMHVMMGV